MARSFSFGAAPNGRIGITRIASEDGVQWIPPTAGKVAVIKGNDVTLHKGPEAPSTQITPKSLPPKPTGFDFQ